MKSKNLTYIALAAAGLFLLGRKAKGTAGCKRMGALSDDTATLANILRGVQNGWYKIHYITKYPNRQYAVCLIGKDVKGKEYKDVYPISEATFLELQKRGYETIE